MEPSGYLSKPFQLSNGNHFESNSVLAFLITTLDRTVSEKQTESSIDLLTTIYKSIKPYDTTHIEKISQDFLLNILNLATQVLKNPKCTPSKIPDLNQVCYSQMILSMRLIESPKEFVDHPAYHGKIIRQMVLKIAAEQEGFFFDITDFIEKYVQFIFKTTPMQNGKPFLIRDALAKNPKFKLKSIEQRFVMKYPHNRMLLSERIKRKEESGLETWTHLKKDNFGSDCSFSSFKALQSNLEKRGPLVPARRLKEIELTRYVYVSTIKYQLMDPYLKNFFNDPIIDYEGNTYSSSSMRGNLRSADPQDAHLYRSNHLVTALVAVLNQEMVSVDETFGKVTELLTNQTSDILFEEPVVGLDGQTYEKGQIPEKDSISNKKIRKILEILKK